MFDCLPIKVGVKSRFYVNTFKLGNINNVKLYSEVIVGIVKEIVKGDKMIKIIKYKFRLKVLRSPLFFGVICYFYNCVKGYLSHFSRNYEIRRCYSPGLLSPCVHQKLIELFVVIKQFKEIRDLVFFVQKKNIVI